MGDWKLTVKDQANPERNGTFLGWSLTLWGECIEESKAKLWEFPEEELPAEVPTSTTATVVQSTTTSSTVESTKTPRPKPTDGLPDDHDVAHGDTENPAFPNPNPSSSTSATSGSVTTSPSLMPSVTPDEGYFHHFTDLLNSSTWLIAATVLAVIFAIAGGLFFWRRRVRRTAEYSAVDGEDGGMALGAVDDSSRRLLGGGKKRKGSGGGRTKELYDAFGEPSDEEDDEEGDPSRIPGGSSEHAGLRYHDDFLEDDQPDSAAHSPRIGSARYRDDEEDLPPREEHEKSGLLGSGERGKNSTGSGGVRSVSPSGGSGDSWEHASADRER